MRRQFDLRDAPDVDELAITDGVAGGAVLHNRPLIEDGSRSHTKRVKKSLSQKIPITLTAGFLDDHAEQEKTDVAVLPTFARRRTHGVFRRRLKHLRGAVARPSAILIERPEARLQTGQARRVRQEMAHLDAFP